MADYTWTAGGDGTNWSDPLNWDVGVGYPHLITDVANLPGGDVVLDVSGVLAEVNITQIVNLTMLNNSVGPVNLSSGATLSGGSCTINGDVFVNTASYFNVGSFTTNLWGFVNITINGGVTLDGDNDNLTFTMSCSGDCIVTGQVAFGYQDTGGNYSSGFRSLSSGGNMTVGSVSMVCVNDFNLDGAGCSVVGGGHTTCGSVNILCTGGTANVWGGTGTSTFGNIAVYIASSTVSDGSQQPGLVQLITTAGNLNIGNITATMAGTSCNNQLSIGASGGTLHVNSLDYYKGLNVSASSNFTAGKVIVRDTDGGGIPALIFAGHVGESYVQFSSLAGSPSSTAGRLYPSTTFAGGVQHVVPLPFPFNV